MYNRTLSLNTSSSMSFISPAIMTAGEKRVEPACDLIIDALQNTIIFWHKGAEIASKLKPTEWIRNVIYTCFPFRPTGTEAGQISLFNSHKTLIFFRLVGLTELRRSVQAEFLLDPFLCGHHWDSSRTH